MPVVVGENESELIRVLGPIDDLATPYYLLMHRDMRNTPRVRAFFDFVIEELDEFRKLLAGRIAVAPRPRQVDRD